MFSKHRLIIHYDLPKVLTRFLAFESKKSEFESYRPVVLTEQNVNGQKKKKKHSEFKTSMSRLLFRVGHWG